MLVTNATTTENNGTAVLDGRTWSNFGRLVINGGIGLDNGATLTNESGGSIDIAAGGTNIRPLFWDGTGTSPSLRNLGTMTKSAAVDQELNVAVHNDTTGTLNVNTAALTINNFTSAPTTARSTSHQARRCPPTGCRSSNASGGTIAGSGTLNLGGSMLTNAGTLSPGASPGTLRVDGDLVLLPSSVLNVEIAGTGAGQYDVLDVRGNAALGGMLNVALPGAYRGAVGTASRPHRGQRDAVLSQPSLHRPA